MSKLRSDSDSERRNWTMALNAKWKASNVITLNVDPKPWLWTPNWNDSSESQVKKRVWWLWMPKWKGGCDGSECQTENEDDSHLQTSISPPKKRSLDPKKSLSFFISFPLFFLSLKPSVFVCFPENPHLLCCSSPQQPWSPNHHHGSSHLFCYASPAASFPESAPHS